MISISELTKHSTKKSQFMKNVFNEVLKKCHKRIKYAAKNSRSVCFYDVPTCVLGLPVYDLSECIKYIVIKLKRNGLDVELRPPRTLLISWEKHQDNYQKPVKMMSYIPEYNNIPSVQPMRNQLYQNDIPTEDTVPRYFLEENILQLMPPPKLHYVEPKYPDTLTVSSRPVQTRQPLEVPPIRPNLKKVNTRDPVLKIHDKKRDAKKYNFNFI
jgi:hypothetical protein